MSKLNIPGSRIIAGLVVASAFAVAPMAAQAAPGDLGGTLTAGSLAASTPTLGNVDTTLTGLNQTVNTTVAGWNVNDPTGSNAGYNITIAASDPTVGGTTAGAGTGGSITYTPQAISAHTGNPAANGPVDNAGLTQPGSVTPVALTTTAATVANAPAGQGQGEWDFAPDTGGVKSLAVVIPGDASAGTYASTLTFTTGAAIN